MEIRARNVNELFSEMFWKLRGVGVRESSRNGPVIRFPEPVITTIDRPCERVLFHKGRDANPIFHLLESIWILAGRRDVAFPALFNSRIGQYSDDKENFNAAYGYRLRHHFGADQVKTAIEMLKKDHTTRQCVLQLWDPADLNKTTLDKACNTELVLSINQGRLDLLVFNRSNDMWFGYAGANPVHFSVIQEFIATAVGVTVGYYRTVSNNLHLYTEMYDAEKYLAFPPESQAYDAYRHGVKSLPIMRQNDDYKSWLRDAEEFCNDPFIRKDRYSFFDTVAHPMAMVSKVRKEKTGDGRYWANQIAAQDWRIATQDWITRREEAKMVK